MEDSYLISVGKLNYKQEFTSLDQPESLLLDIDDDLKDQLEYEEEIKSESFYSYGFYGEISSKIPSEITTLPGCCDPLSVGPSDRLMVKLQAEQQAFEEDRYLQDNFDDETLEDISRIL